MSHVGEADAIADENRSDATLTERATKSRRFVLPSSPLTRHITACRMNPITLVSLVRGASARACEFALNGESESHAIRHGENVAQLSD